MTDVWRCSNCMKDFSSKAYAFTHKKHWPTHGVVHCISEPNIVDPTEMITLEDILYDPVSDDNIGVQDDIQGNPDQ